MPRGGCGPATATADSRDDGYLAELRGMGFVWPEGHEVPLVGMARTICEDLGWGWTPDQITRDMHAAMSAQRGDYAQVAGMVELARTTYCPPEVLGRALLTRSGCADKRPARP